MRYQAFSFSVLSRARCGRPSACRGDGAPVLRSGAFQIFVPGDERGGRPERKSACEVDGVISAQLELLGKLSGLPGQ